MANVRLQDLTAIIHNTSRSNGGKYDLVHVENLIKTDTPIDPNLHWYVPDGITPSPFATMLFQSKNMAMYPRSEADLTNGIQDMLEEAKARKEVELTDDFAKLLMLCTLKNKSLTPVDGAQNLYLLSYDYKLFPDTSTNPAKFKFVAELPFKGLNIAPDRGTVQLTVLMPLDSKIDPVATKGTAPDNANINEQIVPITRINRQTVTFRYQKDPIFTIVYNY